MKEESAGNNSRGFSTIEIIIALALMIVVIVGAVNANIIAQYWSLTSETSAIGLYKAKTVLEEARAASADFQSVQALPLMQSADAADPGDTSCIAGGLCYYTARGVLDISSCSKYVEARVEWRLGLRYPTTTESLYTNITNNAEIIARGGDCLLNEPQGSWLSSTPIESGSESWSPRFSTGIDVLQKKIYLTASSAPQFRIYDVPNSVGADPAPLGSTAGNGKRLNAVDTVRDLSTGRTYAFVTQHASTSQLAVIDVTDAESPVLVSERALSGVDKTGSFPEGWRVFAYSGRLYVTTRETAGPELHIFNINAPTQPSEVVAARREVNGTINDILVREQNIGGTKRYLFVAKSSSNELSIYDVTGDAPTEVVALNLPGSEDGLSVFLTGNYLYLGRAQVSGGPELYVFDVPTLIGGDTDPLATSEVGADVHTIRGSGTLLFLGTSKSNEEFQVWYSDTDTWSAVTANAGRISHSSMPRLARLGMDVNVNWVYLMSQSATMSELLQIVYTP